MDITEDVSKYKDILDKLKPFEEANYEDRLKMLEEFKKKYLDLMNQINKITSSGSGNSGLAVDKDGNIIYGGGTTSGGRPSGGGSGSGNAPGKIDIVDELKQDISGLDKIDPDIIKYVLGYYGSYKETEMPVGKGDISDLSPEKWKEIFDWFGFTPLAPMPTIKNPGNKKPNTTIKNPDTGSGSSGWDDHDNSAYWGSGGGSSSGSSSDKDYSKPSGSGSSDSSAYWQSQKDKDHGSSSSSSSSSHNPSTRPGTVEDCNTIIVLYIRKLMYQNSFNCWKLLRAI